MVRARSTSAATSEGSGETESVPVSMRPASSRSAISPIMRSAWSSTMRMNSRVSAGANCREVPSSAPVEPLMEVSGTRSSWLTMPRNSARWRSSSSSGARSCMVTTTDATAPSSAWIGVALIERGDAAPVGGREHDLLGAHRLGAAQRPRQRQFVEGDLAPVGEAAGEDPEQVLGGAARHAQALDDAPCLAVEQGRAAGPDVEHDHADRGGLDQRLEVGAGALLGAVGARVGDRGRRLRGEQHQDLLVLVGERRAALLLDEIEVADMEAAMAHRRALEGLRLRRQAVGGEAERAHMGRNVGDPDRPLEVAEILEEPRAVGPLGEAAVLLLGEARGDEVLRHARLVDGGDGAEARAGQRPGALDHLAEHRLEVEARADAEARRAERRDALAQRRDLAAQFIRGAHRRAPAGGRIGVPGPGAGSGAGSARPGRFGGQRGEIPVEVTLSILR